MNAASFKFEFESKTCLIVLYLNFLAIKGDIVTKEPIVVSLKTRSHGSRHANTNWFYVSSHYGGQAAKTVSEVFALDYLY